MHTERGSPRRAARRAGPIFAALGDDTRLRLLARLAEHGPLSITALSAGTELTRQAITKHLRRMKTAGVLRETRQGRESLWQVNADALHDAQHFLRAISSQWDAALDRLKRFVEE
jgi:DNA-binding transcriptional ArsR family regulator